LHSASMRLDPNPIRTALKMWIVQLNHIKFLLICLII
jgi:hypothetical protein